MTLSYWINVVQTLFTVYKREYEMRGENNVWGWDEDGGGETRYGKKKKAQTW